MLIRTEMLAIHTCYFLISPLYFHTILFSLCVAVLLSVTLSYAGSVNLRKYMVIKELDQSLFEH